MSEQTTIETPAPEAPAKGQTTYTVQMAREVSRWHDEDHDADQGEHVGWVDIATVTVPQRTPRKVVYRKALEASGLKPAPDSEPLRLRALDAASAAEQPVEPFQPEPEWRVG